MHTDEVAGYGVKQIIIRYSSLPASADDRQVGMLDQVHISHTDHAD